MQASAGRPKDLEKRQRILEVARQLFLQHGYHGSSMDHIAKEAHVTKLTVYNHFQDKENLFRGAIEDTCENTISADGLQLSADSDFEQELYRASELALNVINLPEAIKLEYLLLELAAENNPLAIKFYNASHQRMCLIWSDFFQKALDFPPYGSRIT